MRNHRLVKKTLFVALAILFGTLMAQAEIRTFTNVDGRKAKGELLVMEGDAAVVRLENDSITKIPLKSLSEEDKTFVTKWWEENKDKVGPMDIRVTIDKDTDRVDRTVIRPKGNAGGKNQNANQVVKKHTIDDFNYTLRLQNYTRRNISDITVEYTIYKRVIGRDKSGLSNKTEEITKEKAISQLEAMGTTTFDTEKVRCEDSSESGGKGQMTWKRETILGIVVSLSVGGKVVAKQSEPENFLARLREEEQRESSRN